MRYSLGVLLTIGFMACAFHVNKTVPTVTQPSGPPVLDPAKQSAALQIIATNCVACHGTENMGNLNNITDPNHLIQAGIVVPGNPNASLLIRYVTEGLMPPTIPLSAADITTLTAWVQGTNTTPSPSPAPGGGGTLALQVMTIFANQCASCHGAAGAGGISNITDLAALVQGGYVVPGNTGGSIVYARVANGTMPPGGGVSQADVQTLANWINSGAPAN